MNFNSMDGGDERSGENLTYDRDDQSQTEITSMTNVLNNSAK